MFSQTLQKSRILTEKTGKWIKEYPDQFGIFQLRLMFALLWFSQGSIKIRDRDPDEKLDHHEFLGQLEWMRDSHPVSFVADFLDSLVIPNSSLFLWLVILTELSIAISLGLGLFTKLGSVLGGLMSATLWLFTLGWPEWFWTYPLIFFPHILFFLVGSGKQTGLDRILLKKTDNKLFRALS
ncbi:MAG: DoxX family protein [Candidatus Kariarchaeaceae archaeon]|jgi:uncharacterized membrane protein YphA (DoxX/SURF4 family)